MGLGDMSREDQMRVGLIAVLVLSLECVLEGLVAEAPLRAWFFHAVAVGDAKYSDSRGGGGIFHGRDDATA